MIFLPGTVFNSFTVIEYFKSCKTSRAQYRVKCKCGRIQKILSFTLTRGNTKACRKCDNIRKSIQKNDEYGLAEIMPNDKLRESWLGRLSSIKQRCNNPKSKDYEGYGGRGIKLCERWLNTKNFLKDIITLAHWDEPKKQLDREDNDGNYCLENCRMLTVSENCLNRRTSLKNIEAAKAAEEKRRLEEIEDERAF